MGMCFKPLPLQTGKNTAKVTVNKEVMFSQLHEAMLSLMHLL